MLAAVIAQDFFDAIELFGFFCGFYLETALPRAQFIDLFFQFLDIVTHCAQGFCNRVR